MGGFNWYLSAIINRIWWLFYCGDSHSKPELETSDSLGLGSWEYSGLIQWDRDLKD